jgi:hypothetical protein
LAAVVDDVDRFLTDVFARSPWIGAAGALTDLFSVDAVDTIVSNGARTPGLRMIRDGVRVEPSRFCSPTRIGATTLPDVADARKVIDLYRAGATLVLQSLHRTWPPISRWCAALEHDLGWPVQANAYLTPPGARGLAAHADGHDVLVVPIHGCKHWTVAGIGACTLRPGDVLYMPAGTEHGAVADDESCLHLTIGIHRPTAARIERAALRIARERLGSERSLRDVAEIIASLDDEEVCDSLRRPPRAPADGLLAAAIRRGTIDATTRIEPTGPWTLEPGTDGRVALRWRAGRLQLPATTTASLDHLARGRTAIGDLPGLTPAARLVLVRRLLDEGAVRIVE